VAVSSWPPSGQTARQRARYLTSSGSRRARGGFWSIRLHRTFSRLVWRHHRLQDCLFHSICRNFPPAWTVPGKGGPRLGEGWFADRITPASPVFFVGVSTSKATILSRFMSSKTLQSGSRPGQGPHAILRAHPATAGRRRVRRTTVTKFPVASTRTTITTRKPYHCKLRPIMAYRAKQSPTPGKTRPKLGTPGGGTALRPSAQS
jgi:hypothetical protein